MGIKRRFDSEVTRSDGPMRLVFTAAFGAFLGLALLKFGNPPIIERPVTTPTNANQFVLGYPSADCLGLRDARSGEFSLGWRLGNGRYASYWFWPTFHQ